MNRQAAHAENCTSCFPDESLRVFETRHEISRYFTFPCLSLGPLDDQPAQRARRQLRLPELHWGHVRDSGHADDRRPLRDRRRRSGNTHRHDEPAALDGDGRATEDPPSLRGERPRGGSYRPVGRPLRPPRGPTDCARLADVDVLVRRLGVGGLGRSRTADTRIFRTPRTRAPTVTNHIQRILCSDLATSTASCALDPVGYRWFGQSDGQSGAQGDRCSPGGESVPVGKRLKTALRLGERSDDIDESGPQG